MKYKKSGDMLVTKMSIGLPEELGERTIRYIASDNSTDRDGDVIEPNGWKFDNWLKNPSVLYVHNSYGFPVGRGEAIEVKGNQLQIDVYFPKLEELATDPLLAANEAKIVDMVYCMSKIKMLNAVSVGFYPLKKETRYNQGNEYVGIKYIEQELRELSLCPVPANPNALAIMRKSGIAETVIKTYNKIMIGEKLNKSVIERINIIIGETRKNLEDLEKMLEEQDADDQQIDMGNTDETLIIEDEEILSVEE